MKRLADGVCLVIAGASLTILGIRQSGGRGSGFQGWLLGALILYAAFFGVLLWHKRRRLQKTTAAMRAAVYPVTLVFAFAAAKRAPETMRGEYVWPPRARTLTTGMPWLSERERASWMALAVAHARSGARQVDADVDSRWPLPAGVQVATTTAGDTIVIAARTDNGSIICESRVANGAVIMTAHEAGSAATCRSNRTDSKLRFHPPVSFTPTPTPIDPATQAAPWPQYRGSADKVARVFISPDSVSRHGFAKNVGGEIRSSIAIVGSDAVVGTHGNGTLASISLRDGSLRWQTSLPNWIHEDPVSDGRIIAVGFGDNEGSFWAHAPAGVAAYRAADGYRLWTAFEPNSVMSSPVIFGSRVIYVTAGGVVVARDIASGELLAQSRVPGSVQMAPPALAGGTLIVSAGRNAVCALDAGSLDTRWCRHYAGLLNTDAAAASVFGDRIIQAGTQPLAMTHLLSQWRELGTSLFAATLWDVARGRSNRSVAQRLVGIDVSDGKIVWSHASLSARRLMGGHTSGTASGIGRNGVVVLPVSDAVVGFDIPTGREAWKVAGEGARGPALIADSTVYVFSSSGSVRSLDLRTGHLRCRYRTQLRFDRAGPAGAGPLLVTGTLSGKLLAISKRELDACQSFRVDDELFTTAY